MSRVLRSVIGESQHVFVEGRQIMDVVLAVNEVVDDLVGNKKDGIFCKLIEKAYDCVSLELLIICLVGWVLTENGEGGSRRALQRHLLLL